MAWRMGVDGRRDVSVSGEVPGIARTWCRTWPVFVASMRAVRTWRRAVSGLLVLRLVVGVSAGKM